MIRRLLAAAFVVTSVGACATPQDPPNAPGPLTLAERAGVEGVEHSHVIVATGPATLAAGPVGARETLLSVPFRYRHTAVLTEDVVGHSISVSGVQVPAGSPGYYAGSVQWTWTDSVSELWCFMSGVDSERPRHRCLMKNNPGIAAIAPNPSNPYLWAVFEIASPNLDYVRTPIYERRAIDIPGNLVLEYRFRGWSPEAALLTEYAVSRMVRDFEVPRNAGVAVLRTIGGDVELAPAPGAPDRVVVTLH